MASGQNDTHPRIRPLLHAGGTGLEPFRQLKGFNHLAVKRTHAQEHLPPRRSARLRGLHRERFAPTGGRSTTKRRDSDSGVRSGEVCQVAGSTKAWSTTMQKCTQPPQEPASRKRPRAHNDRATTEESLDERRKRRRGPADKRALVPVLPSYLSVDEQHPIAYWATNKRWPRQYLEQGTDMENILARKRSVSSRGRKDSDTDSATPSSTNQGEQKSREQKSAEYKKPQYATVLATKGVLMRPSSAGITKASQDWCRTMLEQQQTYPQDTLFRDDLFDSTCESVQDKNETRVIRDIALLIVPSAEVLLIRGSAHLQCLIDSVNEGWNNSIAITKTRPQPDYAVGFRREAFTQDQLDRMHPIVGDFNDQSYFMAAWYMYFPFLTCEVKCGAAALDFADRQNAHSTAIAVRAVVELFRAVKREKELHREIGAFSVSHDDSTVRIYGYYAEIDSSETRYYRHLIRKFDFTELDGREKWTAYKFTKNVYDHWMPMHFKRICSAIDQIPAGINFSESQSELQFSEPTRISQDMSVYSIAQSSEGFASVRAERNPTSSTGQGATATPGTSVDENVVFKKPRRGQRRPG
ncbi:hypothetical protein LTR56_026900 [Elasticomyces elasticus]|nr:hypothetical protein LTR56_026900 [Elasticomyces elasticus]KAK4901069.1 hypothetical protein LTR49_027332 [Elasticomyces elasticus]